MNEGVKKTEEAAGHGSLVIGAAAKMVKMAGPVYEEDGIWKMDFKVSEEYLNFHNTFHAGMQYFLCVELLSQYMTIAGCEGATIDGGMHYYRPSFSGDSLTATLKPRKVGKTIGTYLVELTDQENRLVSDAVFTIMIGRT